MVKSKKSKAKSKGNSNKSAPAPKQEDLSTLNWLRDCEVRRDSDGEPLLQLEYHPDDELLVTFQRFLETCSPTQEIVDELYQIWQQTVLNTLLASSSLWKQDSVTSRDQRQLKDQLKLARYKIHFVMHHVVGQLLTNSEWDELHAPLKQVVFQTLQLLPRLAESVPHHQTDLRQVILHFEGKEFLAAVAWYVLESTILSMRACYFSDPLTLFFVVNRGTLCTIIAFRLIQNDSFPS